LSDLDKWYKETMSVVEVDPKEEYKQKKAARAEKGRK